jgi:hypothetical protein
MKLPMSTCLKKISLQNGSAKLGLLLSIFILSMTAIISVPAQALIELKGGYSFLNTNPVDINGLNPSTVPKLGTMNSVSIDAMATLPAMAVGLGVRYETISAKDTSTSGSFKADWTRVSIIVDKRLIDTGVYAGPVATIGVSNDFKYATTINGTRTDYHSSGNVSASGGFELGARLSIFRFGGEAGYMYAPLGQLKNQTAGGTAMKADGSAAQVNLSGPYFRLLFGLGF